MTIHSDWSRIFHSECPAAFLKDIPQGQVGIIDGHLQLMSLHEGIQSWARFVDFLFLRPVLKMYAAGCKKVVLCFDCYDFVPAYKAMTQTSRVQRHEVKVFEPHWDLPTFVPENTMLYLMNRNFKVKLIELVLARLPPLLKLEHDQAFILDYRRVVQYTPANNMVPQPIDDLLPLGESDVKFCRYVTRYGGSALVHAIDGDYLAIALLYYTQHPPSPANRIYIYRQLATLEAAKQKRPRASPKAQKCWVDVQMLHAMCLRRYDRVFTIDPATRSPFPTDALLRATVFLMLCAGTDFSRNLPLLGPKRLWELLPSVAEDMLLAHASHQLYADTVVATLYKHVFAKHIPHEHPSLQRALTSLQSSRLSQHTKQHLPSEHRVLVTLSNLRWVMQYWLAHNEPVDTPMDGTCGFLPCRTTGKPTFADLA